MKEIAFVFSHAPHGTSLGREGLDAIFSISSIINKISVFFINDGVFQIQKNIGSENILSRDYTAAFPILSLYDIKDLYCCKLSLIQRGLSLQHNFILNVNILDVDLLRLKLDSYDAIINF
ncbi:MAG: sulfurtransferase complex subunit TusC [Buchnera aphidicola (Pentalonia nigronervosa)]|uniref:Sulfurtransferase complex subunit TusC n=1 Tax=Buchnera aphidicola (Pentalonia nigronervosa) TaxID=1309793 RepID=A0A7H1AZ00_9GAMM|nr:MAG: sulfurtransferase complex subunit TusC [Buchnera aphidicola (Pentalonia nigronervosa)]